MNEQSCKYRFVVSVDCDKAHVVHKMDHWCWQNRVITRVDQYCELQWDICVIEWIILILFSDFHSLTFLKTDEQRICSKRINHSIICYWFLSLLKVRLIDRLIDCVNQTTTNTWMDERCLFYAVNNNYKIIITNKPAFATRILYIHHSFFQSFAIVYISWMHDWGIESMPILYARIYPFPTNSKANSNSNNNEIG